MRDYFDLFVLKALDRGPLVIQELERCTERARAICETGAKRIGKGGPASLSDVLQRFERAGWLNADTSTTPTSYSLTPAGKLEMERQSKGAEATLATFVETGIMDTSFRAWLNRNSKN